MAYKVRLKLTILAILVHVILCTSRRRMTGFNFKRNSAGLFEMTGDAGEMSISDPVHGVKMGIPHRKCDDGVHGIEIDWDPRSVEEITCFINDVINDELPPFNLTDTSNEMPMHVCLFSPITYPTDLPLSGSHRPLWPMFGEYTYLPPQRWVHSLEHGAIVLLYHPCKRDAPELAALKSLVRDCLGKHVISPYRKIPLHMPYALLAYKHALLVGFFDPLFEEGVDVIIQFIKDHALDAPEAHVLEDGQYSAGLIESATRYSDLKESRENICAFLK